MCQTDNKLVKLRKDRIAYKVESKINGKWVTAYQGSFLKRNVVITAKGKKDIRGSIEGGFFHCFKNKREILNDCKKTEWTDTIRLVKVIIPAKDNTVYSGNACCDWDWYKTICARKIILTDDVVWEA